MYLTTSRRAEIANLAQTLYERAYFRGWVTRLWAKIVRRPSELPMLSQVRQRCASIDAQPPTRRAVRVQNIVGTDGGLGFDRNFYPIDRRSRDRWVSVAELMLEDPTSVPPIQVVQVDRSYYVIDGHHRVSVARVLDHLYLDADVTLWVTT